VSTAAESGTAFDDHTGRSDEAPEGVERVAA